MSASIFFIAEKSLAIHTPPSCIILESCGSPSQRRTAVRCDRILLENQKFHFDIFSHLLEFSLPRLQASIFSIEHLVLQILYILIEVFISSFDCLPRKIFAHFFKKHVCGGDKSHNGDRYCSHCSCHLFLSSLQTSQVNTQKAPLIVD
jgi:hypothetical protein